MKKKSKLQKQNGITLIALVITIIVLLILAGVSINAIFSKDGIIERTQNAELKHRMEQAREKLEIGLSNAGIHKHSDTLYNQNEFLDVLILKTVQGSKILSDVVIVDGFAFNLDRSVPKIGEYIGKEEELIFPELKVSAQNAKDSKTSTITINAKEDKNGINKIEILQSGFVLKTYSYDNVKEEITENFTTKQNGVYSIKVYSKLTITQIATVSGLTASVKYNPNGSTEYKKVYSIKVTANEDIEKVKEIKYQWLQTTEEPESGTFLNKVNNGATITENKLTGKWYLWTLLETESGKTNINRSEVFYFDNEGPTVTLTSTPISETSFTLTATATDNDSGLKECKFYVNEKLKETKDISTGTAICNVTVESMGNNYDCYVILTDKTKNETKQAVTAKTKVHTWEKWSVNSTSYYTRRIGTFNRNTSFMTYGTGIQCAYFDNLTGKHYTSYNQDYRYHYSGYLFIGSDVYYACYYCSTGASACEKVTYANLYNVIVEEKATYSKGTTKYNDTINITSTAYPTNGKSGDYWYVYKGIM